MDLFYTGVKMAHKQGSYLWIRLMRLRQGQVITHHPGGAMTSPLLWKYFGGVGAQEKMRWCLSDPCWSGFSAALLGILVDKGILLFEPLSIAEPGRAISFAMLGIVISCVAIS